MSDALPDRVRIREVGPRDGFQNEPEVIATDDKVELIDGLARTGLHRLEVTSFVRADVIPQLADGARGAGGASTSPTASSLTVLIPNEKGLDKALEHRDRFHEVNCFLSASETHNRKNVNRSVEESLSGLERVLRRAREERLHCEGDHQRVVRLPVRGRRAARSACSTSRGGCATPARVEIGFGDTTGMANPRQVRGFFERARRGGRAGVELTAHFHNTRGQGLANVLAALEAGCESFESSFGELGGCPVPKGATGNIATEDLVSMLHEMGVETGIDLEQARRLRPPRAAGARPAAGQPHARGRAR